MERSHSKIQDLKVTRFEECLADTLKWEGGWSNHPKDPGGATMRGVIQRVYNAWRTRNGLPHRSVRFIDESELQAIYKENYWIQAGAGLPHGVDLAVFDYGVNSGPSRSIRYLQSVLGVASDGQMGPVTLAGVEAADPDEIIKKLCQARRRFVRQIRTYPYFGRGWERRINGIEIAALDASATTTAFDPADLPLPKPDPDAQSATQGRATVSDAPPTIGAKTAAGVAMPAAGAVGGALASEQPATPVPETSAVSVPNPPTEAIESLSAWQQFAEIIKDIAGMTIEHWPFVLGGVGVYFAITWGIPKIYGRFQ